MGRRSAAHSFLPGRWVFPGGSVCRADFDAAVTSELMPDVVSALAPSLTPRRARALAVAAIRETREETGLVLGKPIGAPASSAPPRSRMAVMPDLGILEYIARFVTPPHLPKRFDTRFFVADAAKLTDREPSDTRELEHLHWISLDRTAALGLLLPTEMVLGHLRSFINGSKAAPIYHRFRRT